MRIVIIGGGPSGLYLAILMKQADPRHEITIYERNRPDDTFGFGVVFSDATLENLARADPISHAEITRNFAHWRDIETHVGGQRLVSTGHGFCGLGRKELLIILRRRCADLGIECVFEHEVRELSSYREGADLFVGADGVSSLVRQTFAAEFEPDIDLRPNRFVWLGTTFPFQSFTFYFKENEHGLFRVHAYRYREEGSTFIVECTGDTFRRTGLAEEDEDATLDYVGHLFERELDGHPLIKNRSIWRSFPTVKNRRWHAGNMVLVGDAAHTAHFSIGSGTKLALEDSIALAEALGSEGEVEAALSRYERERRPVVEKLQRAAQVSLEWFEGSERYLGFDPMQFTFSLLTRSLRVTHENLRRRDPQFVARLDAWFAGTGEGGDPPEPWQVPYRLREIEVPVRIAGAESGGEAGLRIAEPGEGGRWQERASAIQAAGARAALRLSADRQEDLAASARRAAEAGFDWLEVDGAGDAAAAAAVAAARASFPEDRPVTARLPLMEGDVAVAAARTLAQRGADLIAVAPPGPEAPRSAAGRFASAQVADRIRQELGVPTLAEGLRSRDDVSSVLAAGRADLCRLD